MYLKQKRIKMYNQALETYRSLT